MDPIKELGYSENKILLIIHADDAGLSHSENMATIQALEKGIVNSYSIMVPCPWYYDIACFAKNNTQFDYGIHLTLTCEWQYYKFGPVLPVSQVPSLVDQNGYFYKTREELKKHASAKEVKQELQAQIEKACNFGLYPTHLDSHMYSVGACTEFFDIYKDLGEEYNIPILLNKQLLKMVGLSPGSNIGKNDFLIENVHYGTYEMFENGELREYYNNIFDTLTNGLNIILIHPALDNTEMRGITANHPNFGAAWRQIDFDSFTSPNLEEKLLANNIELITWRDIKRLKNKSHYTYK